MTRLSSGASGIEPSGEAAIDESIAILASLIDFWIIGPTLRSGFGIESDNPVEGSG